jgi:hypothetical protein
MAILNTQSVQTLDYASGRTRTASRPLFKSVLSLLAIFGAVANLWFIYLTVEAMHRAHWAYRDLMHNPRAHGRLIEPETIASLQKPWFLWVSSAALILASAFGLLLAIHLIRSLWQISRSPVRGWEGIARYRRCKPLGVAATALAFFCFASANFNFWVAATAHFPIGGGPPVIETAVLVICALLPWWWIGKQADGI